MKVEYQRTARHSYMVIREADFIFENYEVQMILHNGISSLLQMQIIMEDGRVEYWYDVTGMQSLEKQFLVSAVDNDRLRFLLQSLCDMKRQMEDYMLDDGNIVFSSSMIFYDRNTETIRFCYIPGYVQMKTSGIRGLMEEILQHLDHADSKAVHLAYDIYELCAQSEFTISDCQRCIGAQQTEKEVLAEDFENDAELFETDSGETEKTAPEKHLRWGFGRRKKKWQKPEYREILRQEQMSGCVAEPIRGWDETVCFSETQMKRIWELSYQGNGLEEDLKLEKFPFLIGKDNDRVDGALRAQTVSRIHAQIREETGKLYLEDYNSTNGTYLNGRLIPMNTPIELHAGDRIIFATEEYILIDRQIPKC